MWKRGISEKGYTKLAQYSQSDKDRSESLRLSGIAEDLKNMIEPYVPEGFGPDGFDGVLENLESIPPEQLTENHFVPLFQYFNDMLKNPEIADDSKEIYKDLSRKLYYHMVTDFGISNSVPVDEY